MTAQQMADHAETMVVPKLTEILPMVAGVKTTPERRKILATKCLPQAALWTKKRKAKYAGVCLKTWYNAECDPKFKQLAADFITAHIGEDVPEIWSSYVLWAKLGDRHRQERILQQLGILDKPEKGGDTNIGVTITIEEKEKIDREITVNRTQWMKAHGYTLDTDS